MKKIICIVAIIFSFTAIFAQAGGSDEEEMAAKDEKQANEQSEKDVNAYVKDLSSSNPQVVIDACNWLGDNEKSEGNKKMIKLLAHDNTNVRKWASANLGMLGEKDAVGPLVKRLQKESVADVRYAMILAVSRIGLSDDKLKDKLIKIKEKETDPLIIDYISKIEEKYNK